MERSSFIKHYNTKVKEIYHAKTHLCLFYFVAVPSVVIGSGSAVVYGGNITIACSISSNPSAQSVSWQKTVNGATTTLNINGNQRYQGGTLSNPSLTIYNVNLADKGEYRCVATNIVGSGQSGPAIVDVTGSKTFLHFWRTVILA